MFWEPWVGWLRLGRASVRGGSLGKGERRKPGTDHEMSFRLCRGTWILAKNSGKDFVAGDARAPFMFHQQSLFLVSQQL